MERSRRSSRHHEDISLAKLFDELLELGAITLGAGEFFLEQLFATGCGEALGLPVEVLIVGRDPGIPQLHASIPEASQNILPKS